jgi:hypothetical protein
VYEWLPIGDTLVRIDNTASPICPSCTNDIETHNHIFRCNNIHRQQTTTDCLTQIEKINIKWGIPIHLATNMSLQLRAWVSNEQSPPITEAATNQTHVAAFQTQARIGWGRFFKGFCAKEFQQIINEQTNDPRNSFEQIRWTCEIIQCVWDSETEHWKLRNGDKHGHTPQETEDKKRARLLTTAKALLLNKDKVPREYKKLFPSLKKLQSKRTRNLETWVSTTKQTVHYLLNVNSQADDDPANEIHPATTIQIDIPHPAPQGLPAPSGSEASQVPPNTTA